MNNSPQNIRMMKAAMFHEEGLPSVAWLIELIEGERQEEIAADLRDFIDASGGFNRVEQV